MPLLVHQNYAMPKPYLDACDYIYTVEFRYKEVQYSEGLNKWLHELRRGPQQAPHTSP